MAKDIANTRGAGSHTSPFPYINVARAGNNLGGKVGLLRKICQAKYAVASVFSQRFKTRRESSIRGCAISDAFFTQDAI